MFADAVRLIFFCHFLVETNLFAIYLLIFGLCMEAGGRSIKARP